MASVGRLAIIPKLLAHSLKTVMKPVLENFVGGIMKKVVVTVLALVVVVIAIILVLAAVKPATFRVERSVVITAAPDKIFPLIADFHQWARWSPFDKMDPTMKREYGGAAQGIGARYSWEGKHMAGVGQMEILEAEAPSRILVKLSFSKPMKAQNTVEFTLAPLGDGTRVSWAMYGPNSYVANIFHVFMDMDKMVGKSFDDGLAGLKEIAEKQ
jgi:uncharacterized protein YndB with AHSA1/START domain